MTANNHGKIRLAAAGLFIVLGILVWILAGCVGQQQAATDTPAAAEAQVAVETQAASAADAERSAAAALSLETQIPVDPQVRLGRLDNGLTYYVRPNREPENRAELRLVVNAGSVLEDEDQLGLAHFLEHMAFNGTERFEKQEIVDYMESIGMPFGPEVNAYTNYDETVYMLQIPTEDPEIMETAVKILEDWAHLITLDPDEVEKERPIIVEEWRLRRGAEARMRDRQYPILLKDARYVERKPIGEVQIIETAPVEAIRRFYMDWYRPDLMAVVAVGDFDASWIEQTIIKYFSNLQPVEQPRRRVIYPVPDHPGTLYAPATDPEATSTRVSLYVKAKPQPQDTVGDYRRELVESMYNNMLNERFEELTKKADAPFTGAGSFSSRFIRSMEAYVLAARVRDARISESLEVLLTETERVRRHGFTSSELQRTRERFLTWIEQVYRDRENIESETLAESYVGNYLEDEPIPDIEFEYRLFQEFVPTITLAEINRLASELLQEDNRVVLVNAPESEVGAVPDEAGVRALFASVAGKDISPYEDRVLDQPLFTAQLEEGRINERRSFPEIGFEELLLSNGVRVILKVTDFKEEEILFGAFSPGGHSLVPDERYVAAATAANIVNEAGLNGFDAISLQKKLTGKVVTVDPWIGELYEGMRGSTRPQDLEILLQLIYLYFTEPRRDEQSYLAYRQRLLSMVENRESSPISIFWDTVRTAISQDHFRSRPWTAEVLEEMDLDMSLQVYRERFADAGDFTFVFVGNFDPVRLESLIVSYLGSLPSGGRVESWRDVEMDPPAGIVEREVNKGLEPQSRVQIVFGGSTAWSLRSRLQLEALKQVLDITLRENVREEAGGSYDIGVDAELNRYPDQEYFVYVGFGCAPDQVQILTRLVFDQIARIREQGPAQKDVDKVREILRREHEQNLKTNDYWLGILQLAYINDLDPKVLLDFDARLKSITVDTLRNMAVETLDPNNYVRVVLNPGD
ncbi:MAG: insulinase family protein [Spirochaetaceae bacterium]|nr:MAG: insulinase family protein [Spirochaetaceae bacterium]